MAKRTKTDLIVVHCSATRPMMDIGAKEIRRWHKELGWEDIGYHFVIRRNGEVEKGRRVDAVGSHAKGYNDRSIGICLVGGVDQDNFLKAKDNFTLDQMNALYWLLEDLHKQYPDAKVLGHRDLPNVKKECPSFDVRKWGRGMWGAKFWGAV